MKEKFVKNAQNVRGGYVAQALGTLSTTKKSEISLSDY